jgi:hypothetical protein
MNNNVLLVLQGFLNLTDSEKEELVKQINKYNQTYGKAEFKRDIGDKVKSVHLGPLGSGTCKCCGR